MRTIYIVYRCDDIQYFDLQDWSIKAFLSLSKAEKEVKKLDAKELKSTCYYHRIAEVELGE